jgi:hypothetical protein
VTDSIVAGLATGLGALVWSLDADFDRRERLGLIERCT